MKYKTLFVNTLFCCFSVTVIFCQNPYLLILGIAQDGGFPQAGCAAECCTSFYSGKEKRKQVSCLAIVDPKNKKTWMIDATPDFPAQYKQVSQTSGFALNGILLTHAHIGHYTGLMYLGREVMNSQKMPVFAMPRMKYFLETNGPWSQLIKLNNIELIKMANGEEITLSDQISILPMLVPHRDEFSETVGFEVRSASKKVLFIPDIDKWNKWDKSIIDLIKSVDVALIDGTFYKNGEIKGRDMKEIPHPFIEETLNLLDFQSIHEKNKIKFIHFNHTNPVLRNTKERKRLLKSGFNIATEGERIGL